MKTFLDAQMKCPPPIVNLRRASRAANRFVTWATIAIVGVLANIAYTVPSFGQIVGTAQLNVERRGHTATLLEDGKVLIVGGDNQNGMVSQAELLDPVSQTPSLAATSIVARTDHTAIRLADARVLVIGGRDQSGVLTSTEIYDPMTATFIAGPSLTTPRSGHTSTVLSDGKILIAGGDVSGSAELYNPATQSFSLIAANMMAARKFHSAILTSSGQVLIVGGVNGQNTVLNTAEVFDPSSQSFYLPHTDMQTPRALATLKLLADGKVQIIGGDAELSMEVFDPTNGIFIAKALLPPNADLLGATLSTQSRAALFSPSISQDPLLQRVLTPEQLALLDRADQSITELPSRNQALIAGGINSAGQILNSAKLVSSSRASVTTDKTDYAPGQIVTINGSGFQPDEQVDIYFHEFPEEYPDIFFSVIANQQGSFVTAEFAPQEIDLGRIFTLTAIGQSSGFVAQTAFKDDKSLTITFAGTGTGTIAVSVNAPNAADSFNCTGTPNPCSSNVHNNATGTITATASPGSVFIGWSASNFGSLSSTTTCTGTTSPCNFFMGTGSGAARTLTATFNTASNPVPTTTSISPASKNYGDAGFTMTVNGTNFISTSVVRFAGSNRTTSFVSSTQLTADIPASDLLTVGNFNITVFNPTPGGGTSNAQTFTVNPRPITVTPTAGQFKTYGSVDPTLTYSFAPALIGTDTFTGALARDPGENVGLYNITVGTLALSSNYTLNFTSGVQFEIKKLTIVVTPNAGQYKTYGSADPTLAYGFTPALITGDSFTGALARDPGENVGLYNITVGTLALSSNYTLNFTSGVQFEIKKRAVTVTADAKTKNYGDADPALTYQITTGSLAFSDAFTGALTRVAGENVGVYAILQGTLALSSNYSLTYVGANLTINQATLTVTANNQTIILGNSDPSFTFQYNGFKGADTAAVIDTPPSCSVSGPHSNVGAYAIVCSGGVDNNYAFSYVNGTLTVIYNFTGFFRPVDNLPVLNIVKAGSAVPVKFSLNGNQGLSIFAGGYPTSGTIACNSTDLYDYVEETVTAGGSSLSYDASANQYVYVWKTEKSWVGSCRQLVVKLSDGTYHRANFNFSK
jgi:MBG domain (YGX type)/Kelch motif